jgi:hypothetical protein
MGTATQVTTFSDLYTDLQNRVREQTGVSSTENQAKRYINIALHDMHIGHAEDFHWAERSAVLLTQPQYTTGTATIAKGSTALTGVNGTTLWNTQNAFGIENMRAGGKITFAGSLDVYEISSVTDDYNAVLTGKFVGTSLTTETYTYFEDEYALASDFLRPIDQQHFSDAIPIELIARTDFRRKYPTNGIPGHPKVGTITDKSFGSDTTPVRKIRFHPPPNDAFNIPYAYVTSNLAVTLSGAEQTQLVNDDDEPIVPLRYRHAIVFHALYHWYRDKKNDQRSQEAKAEYDQVLTKIANDVEIGGKHASLRVKRHSYVRGAKRPWRGGKRRYDTDGKFDRMEI